MRIPATALALLLSGLPALSPAQTIWRCGNTYSQVPCEQGTTVAAADPRTPADARRAEAGARVDAQRAQTLEKARLAQEKAAPRAVVMGPAQAAPERPHPAPAPETGTRHGKAKGKAGAKQPPSPFTAVAVTPAAASPRR